MMSYKRITAPIMKTAIISFRIPTEVKDSAKIVLEENGITISELCQNVLTYVAETRKLPIRKTFISEEDEELIQTARQRLKEPGSVNVKLKDL